MQLLQAHFQYAFALQCQPGEGEVESRFVRLQKTHQYCGIGNSVVKAKLLQSSGHLAPLNNR